MIMSLSASVLLLFVSSLIGVRSQGFTDQEGYWITPPVSGASVDFRANPIYSLDSVQRLEWVSYIQNYSVLLWQQNSTSPGAIHSANPLFTHKLGDQTPSYVLWPVQTYELDLDESNVFYLTIGQGSGDGGFNCHYFNISRQAVTSSTTTTAQPTGTVTGPSASAVFSDPTQTTGSATSKAASSNSVSSDPSSSSASTALSSPEDSMSATVKIALGVGVGVGVPILLLLGVFIGMRLIKTRRSSSTTSSGSDHKNFLPGGSDDRSSYAMKSPAKTYGEVSRPPVYYEADSRSYGPFEVSGSPPNQSADPLAGVSGTGSR